MRLDLNLSLSHPWCNKELKSFLRLYVNIKLDFSRSPVSHLWFCWWNTCSAYTTDTVLLNFFLFKGVCTFLSIWEQDFLQIHLRPTIHACGFCSESKFTTLPFSLFSESQVYQSLLPQGLNATFISEDEATHLLHIVFKVLL